MSKASVERRLEEVSRFFKDYFRNHEQITDIADDDDLLADDAKKIIKRAHVHSKGEKPRICNPLGRLAETYM